jgi:nanoRNase/pAp phosphatase (c-di-AMP/oligoRNAs hydrolase)
VDEFVLGAKVAEARDPVIVTHRRADRDAVGAAVGLAELLDAPATICLPAGATADAQPLLEGYETVDNADQLPHDAMIVVDAPSTDRIAPVQVLTPLFLFDHHPPADLESLANTALVDEDAGSTSELVYRVARTSSWDISPAAALALVTGILDDTDYLHDAGATQVEHVADLLGTLDDRAGDLASMLDTGPDSSERMARIKATARASFHGAGDVTLAVSNVGGHEGAAARALRSVGVDCALVWSEQRDGVRVVGRCSEAFAERLPLGTDLLPGLVRNESATAGGHPTAGTATLPNTSPEVMPDRLVRAVEDGLGLQFGVLD